MDLRRLAGYLIFLSVIGPSVFLGSHWYFSELEGNKLLSARDKIFVPPPIAEPSIMGAFVPHHDVARSVITQTIDKIREERQPNIIVLVGPDHFDRSNAMITTTKADEVFGIPIETHIAKVLIASGAKDDRAVIAAEHSIGVPLAVIAEKFPRVRTVPILLSTKMPRAEVEALARRLDEASPRSTVFIASVDFSHFLTPSATDFHDTQSIGALMTFDSSALSRSEVDSWQSLYLVRQIAYLRGASAFELLTHKNTSTLTQNFYEENTGYVGALLRKGEATSLERPVTVLAVGDILLARDVQAQMERYGDFYPFKGIAQFLRGVDIVLGNLEGPIVENSTKVPISSTRFMFPKESAALLYGVGFSALNIANNHIRNAGAQGVTSTIRYLSEAGIVPVGLVEDFGSNTVIKKVGGRRIGIAGFSMVSGYFNLDSALKIIHDLAVHSDFTVVTVHWGTEYVRTASDPQRHIAQAFVEAGADVVFGHHPHVVQGIETIKGKPVFYSLGNFIFDQYGTKETNEGLAVGIEILDKYIRYQLFPLALGRAQPRLMRKEERERFLNNLATLSPSRLYPQISRGIIEIEVP